MKNCIPSLQRTETPLIKWEVLIKSVFPQLMECRANLHITGGKHLKESSVDRVSGILRSNC